MTLKKMAPSTKPPATGSTGEAPLFSTCSIAGASNDHMDAEIIMPAAKTKESLVKSSEGIFLEKNTTAAVNCSQGSHAESKEGSQCCMH